MQPNYARRRRVFSILIGASLVCVVAIGTLKIPLLSGTQKKNQPVAPSDESTYAINALNTLSVKGRAPKTGYNRSQFGDGWALFGGCDTRNIILFRDMRNTKVADDNCTVLKGTLSDPYTGKAIEFTRGSSSSNDVQIDHVVALSDAWQKGAQNLSPAMRQAFANDGLNLLAVDGPANQQKSDGDAATWLPSNKDFRCRYIARQIAVKKQYKLWITSSEKEAMLRVLSTCPDQRLPIVDKK